MSANTKIEWTDHSASPWHGCSHGVYTDADGSEHEHPGCTNCYAEAGAKRNPGTLGIWGKEGTRVLSASFWDNCRRWNKAAEKAGVVQSVFPSICDPFESWGAGKIHNSKGEVLIQSYLGDVRDTYDETVEPWEKFSDKQGYKLLTMDDVRRDLFSLIDECQWLRFLLLTKRPQNIRKMWPACSICQGTGLRPVAGDPGAYEFFGDDASCPICDRNTRGVGFRSNVALFTSVSDQATYEALKLDIMKCADLVPIVGLSAEPLVGPIQLGKFGLQLGPEGWSYRTDCAFSLIIGGESGRGSRPCDVDWIRSLVKQGQANNLHVYVKQLGANVIDRNATIPDTFPEEQCWPDGTKTDGQRILLKHPKGGDPSEWPEDLRVREMSKVERTVSA